LHPAAGNPDGTLVNALLFHCKTLRRSGANCGPGIVHRSTKKPRLPGRGENLTSRTRAQ